MCCSDQKSITNYNRCANWTMRHCGVRFIFRIILEFVLPFVFSTSWKGEIIKDISIIAECMKLLIHFNKLILTEFSVIISCVLLPINNLIHVVTCWKNTISVYFWFYVLGSRIPKEKKITFSNLHDLNPHVPQDSLQWNDMNSGLLLQTPALDHSAHFS